MVSYFIVWLLIISAVFTFLATCGFYLRRRCGHRPLAVRIVCGLLAVFLLGSMLHGLRAQIRQSYTADTSDDLHAPFQAVELTADELAAGEFDLLVQLVAGTFHEQTFFPMEARELRVPWPEGQGETLEVNMQPAGRDVQISLRPGEVHDWSRPRDPRVPHIEMRFTHAISQRGGGSSSRVMPMRESVQVFHRDRTPFFRHPYSLVPGGEANLVAICVITPIAIDDPGGVVPLQDFTAKRAGEIRDTLSRTHSSHGYSHGQGWFDLMQWTGPQFFLLVLTAILAAQCFRRRGLGFTLCMTLLMIGLVSMDKHHQTQNQRRAENVSLSASEREIARQMSEVSFFFR